jgi:hypothetical protein
MPDLTRPLHQVAAERWLAGRKARGLAPDAPFDGDPVAELAEELADAYNYVNVAEKLGRIDAREALRIRFGLKYCWNSPIITQVVDE